MRRWQCGDCGTTYQVPWLSHCPRCEAMPRRKAKRSRSMAKITLGGASNVQEGFPVELDVAVGPVINPAEALEAEVLAEMPVTESLAPVVETAPEPEPIPVKPEPVSAPAPALDAPVVASKGGAL